MDNYANMMQGMILYHPLFPISDLLNATDIYKITINWNHNQGKDDWFKQENETFNWHCLFYLFWVETGRVGRHNIFTASTKFMAHNTNAPHIAEEKDSQTKISAFTHFQVRWKMHITDRNQLLKVHFKLFVNLRSSCSIENLPDQGIWQISTLNLLVIGFQRIHKN